MIEVTTTSGIVEVKGHADGPEGRIVCAAVSAVTQALAAGLKEVAGLHTYEEQESGFMRICWRTDHKLTKEQRAILNTWRLAMLYIQDASPEANITINGGP